MVQYVPKKTFHYFFSQRVCIEHSPPSLIQIIERLVCIFKNNHSNFCILWIMQVNLQKVRWDSMQNQLFLWISDESCSGDIAKKECWPGIINLGFSLQYCRNSTCWKMTLTRELKWLRLVNQKLKVIFDCLAGLKAAWDI